MKTRIRARRAQSETLATSAMLNSLAMTMRDVPKMVTVITPYSVIGPPSRKTRMVMFRISRVDVVRRAKAPAAAATALIATKVQAKPGGVAAPEARRVIAIAVVSRIEVPSN